MRTLSTSKRPRSLARLAGCYTTQEAAQKLGVDPATLRYRRDTADAKKLWELLDIQATDPMNDLLSRSHRIYNKRHYYECIAFDKFVRAYLKRPEVIRARKRKLTFPQGKREALTYVITKPADIDKLAQIMKNLLASDGVVQCSIYTP